MNLFEGEQPRLYAKLYFVSLLLLVASMPLSKFTMSVFQFATLGFWLWHGVDNDFVKEFPAASLLNPIKLIRFLGQVIKNVFWALIAKFAQFFRNKAALAIASLMLLHVIGLIWTTDFHYAMNDMRIKVPIFILPLFLSTGPRVSTRTFYWILAGLIAAVLGGSIYRMTLFLNLTVANSRSLSAHTSHITYSLNAVFAVFAILFFVGSKGIMDKRSKILLLAIGIWIMAFLAFMNYTTGILIFAFVGFLLLIYLALRIKKVFFKIAALTGVLLMFFLPLFYVISVAYQFLHVPAVDFSMLDKQTKLGNTYFHDTINFKTRNGKWAGLYICEKEMRESWSRRSQRSLDSLDPKKQVLRNTLISYMASKGLRKDADGIAQLKDAEIRLVEQGVNRSNFKRLPGPRDQIEDFVISYRRYVQENDANSSSMIQRFEYWHTSMLIIGQHLWTGVGTGDLALAFKEQYEKMNSSLAPQNRLRSHNEYLAITVAFGIFGLLWFVFAMFYPGFKARGFSNYFFLVYWIIIMASMLTEDTIESQEGVTFYVLLAALMLLGREKTEKSEQLFEHSD